MHRLLLGTHTSNNEQNYVQIATVHLPKLASELPLDKYDDTRGGTCHAPPPLPLTLWRRDWSSHRYRTSDQGRAEY